MSQPSIASFMSILKIARTLSLLACIVGFGIVRAAEISLAESGEGQHPMNGILIEGPIVKGDFKRFEYLALSSPKGIVWLASPGGDLAEAMKIGQFVRRMKLPVWAPENNKKSWSIMIHINDPRNNLCTSACFFIYAAGVRRSGDVLGVHRPRITEEDLRSMSMEQAAFGQISASEVTSVYLRKMGIPNSMIEKMNSTKPNDIQWLGEDEVKSLSGYIPEYQDWLDAKCPWGAVVPDDQKPCKECSADELMARWKWRAMSQNFDCKSGLFEGAQETARSEILDEYVKSGHLKEVAKEQKHACATLTTKNQRECPKGWRAQ
jgi:hypothetical protein